MSHRAALALSIALTLVLATGLFIWQDRLFGAAAFPDLPSVTTPPLTADGDVSVTTMPLTTGDNATDGTIELSSAAAPRVIEIPLPAAAQNDPQALTQFDDGQSLGFNGDDDHERDYHDDHDDHDDHHDGDHDD
ncbi:MAG: hypothetical protein IT338_11560 [Thermomicrobiales bacterium]|nr:hypothetical protein [Thermomicrobiales bacterium]